MVALFRCTINHEGSEPTAAVCVRFDPTEPGAAVFRERC
jgi:hypothetical protein